MNAVTWILFATQFIIFGSLFLVLPSFRRGQFFGVTVPVDFDTTGPGHRILQRYRVQLLTVFALCIAAGAVGLHAGHEIVCFLSWAAAAIAGVLLWSRAYKDAKAYRTTVQVVRTAALRPVGRRFPWVEATAGAPLAIVGWMLHTNWSRLPAAFPRHFSLAGHADSLVPKTPGAVYGPLLCGCIAYGLVLFLSVGLPGTPRRKNAFACATLPLAGWLITLIFSVVAAVPLAAIYGIAPGTAVLAIPILTAVGGISIAVALVFTAMRSRQTMAPYGDTADTGWKAAGMIYYNPADPALWVDKRLGIGWTLNFARPQSWMILGALLAVVAVTATVASLR